MRKLVLLVALSGADGCLNAGDIYECEDAEAERLIEAGIAKDAEDKKTKK